MKLPFTKMHGLGNDFMVIDLTRPDLRRLRLSPGQIRHLADRQRGVGFDQLLQIHPPDSADVDFNYRIYNVDGSESEHCGNGARCIARYIAERGLSQSNPLHIKTVNRLLTLTLHDDGQVSVDMGAADFTPAKVPFKAAQQTEIYRRTVHLRGEAQEVAFAALSMGNPHAVILVDDLAATPVTAIGTALGQHPDFPEGANVGFMQVRSRREADLRVVERGVGETLACGSGACAAFAAGHRQGLLDERVCMHLAGGDLQLCYENQSVQMTGPAETVYEGSIYMEQL